MSTLVSLKKKTIPSITQELNFEIVRNLQWRCSVCAGDQVEISASLSNDNKSKSASLNFLTEVENKSDNQCRISSSLGSELWNTWNLFFATNIVRRLCGKYVPTYSIKCVSPGKPALGCGLPRCQQRMIIAVCVPTVFCNCKWSPPLNINTLDIAQSF